MKKKIYIALIFVTGVLAISFLENK
ncbi:hypothetical protein CGSSp14BS69_05382 [Streptococcus pneumoniae SP14-BS69]|nr:hypothetical protein CGSSp14BS69_05382 [Streptococcus pneumoniae SP14-BS69]